MAAEREYARDHDGRFATTNFGRWAKLKTKSAAGKGWAGGAARYSTQKGRAAHSARPNRESLSKRLGKVARQIKARDGNRCVYCKATKESSGAHLHLDHLEPKSFGGEDIPTNLVLACRSCNSARKNKSLVDWCHMRGYDARALRAHARRKLPEV